MTILEVVRECLARPLSHTVLGGVLLGLALAKLWLLAGTIVGLLGHDEAAAAAGDEP